MFSLESPHRGDSNEYTQHTIVNIKQKITPNYPKSSAIGFSQGTQERVRNSRGKRAIRFEPLKFYCIRILLTFYFMQIFFGSWCKKIHSKNYGEWVHNLVFLPYLQSGPPGRIAQSVGHLTRLSEVLGSIPGLATYFRFSFR